MKRAEKALSLNEEGLLAEVVGFETDEVASQAFGSDVDTYGGKRYIDFTGGIAVHACGHTHPEIVEAITAQAGKVQHVSDIMRHAPQLELAAYIREIFDSILPGEDPWTFLFMNSGSESIDSAAKLALKATGRSELAAFEGAFHGRTLLATALSRSKTLHWAAYEPFLAPLRAHIHHLPAPRCTDCFASKREECCLDSMERLLDESGDKLAAIFFESIQGEGGYIPLEPQMAKKMRALTKERNVLLIADEIQAGWGRTGRWFGFEYLGIEPDIVVFGKAVGGGMPLAGIAARKSLMQKWTPGEHGTTFGGNPISCSAGLAALRVIEREGLVERACVVGEEIKASLMTLRGANGLSDVRGRGLMIGVEFRDERGAPDYARCEAIKQYARKKGLLLLSCGAKIGKPSVDNAAIRLIPPLNISNSNVQQGIALFKEAIQAVPPSG